MIYSWNRSEIKRKVPYVYLLLKCLSDVFTIHV